MPFALLSSADVVELRRRPFTYAEVGSTATSAPPGYRHFSRTRTLPAGRDFAAAVHDLMTWQMHQRCGLRVSASSPEIQTDTVTVMRLGLGPAALTIPCRVVYIVDEPDRRGFAYGTLTGHPESGEEAFILHHRADGRTDFTVSAFSRPASLITKLGGPLATQAQHLMTCRYLRSLDA